MAKIPKITLFDDDKPEKKAQTDDEDFASMFEADFKKRDEERQNISNYYNEDDNDDNSIFESAEDRKNELFAGNTMNFEWCIGKRKLNLRKHDIKFEDAAWTLENTMAPYEFDKNHSTIEPRYTIVDYSPDDKLIFIVFTMRHDETVIRIISARKVTSKQRKAFERRGM